MRQADLAPWQSARGREKSPAPLSRNGQRVTSMHLSGIHRISQQVPPACWPGRFPDRAPVHGHLRQPDRRPGRPGRLDPRAGAEQRDVRHVAAEPPRRRQPDRGHAQRPVPVDIRAALRSDPQVTTARIAGTPVPPDHATAWPERASAMARKADQQGQSAAESLKATRPRERFRDSARGI